MSNDVKKILVVDDEALIAFEVAHAIQDLGYQVVGPALRLQEAVKVAQKEDFDAACLDVNLGRGETSEPIVRVLKDRGIPYLFVSAYSVTQIDFAEPDDKVVSKPISVTALGKVLTKIAA